MTTTVRIEATSFLMGDASGRDDERPLHRVRVDAFELAAVPVTNAEYARFVDATGYEAPPFWSQPSFDHPAQPVVGVSWLDTVAYCAWLGPAFRLPSEAEWECAARGGVEGAAFPWGDDARTGYATRTMTGPDRVARSAPNAYGLYDLGENVHEWCADWYDAQYYATSPEHNPCGPETGTRRASRGGSWRHQIKITRCAARSSLPPHLRYADYGFRIASGSSGGAVGS